MKDAKALLDELNARPRIPGPPDLGSPTLGYWLHAHWPFEWNPQILDFLECTHLREDQDDDVGRGAI